MTRLILHIGLPECGGARIQSVLDAKRAGLAKDGVLLPRGAGRLNHTRAYMAVTDPDHVDPLRFHRGHASAEAQTRLYEDVRKKLAREIEKHKPDLTIISATQLATLSRISELQRLRDLVAPLAAKIDVVAYLDAPARLLVRHYEEQIREGRVASLREELELAEAGQWRDTALAQGVEINPTTNAMPEAQSPPFWLDFQGLEAAWSKVFGTDHIHFRPYDPALFASDRLGEEITQAFALPRPLGKVEAQKAPAPASAEWLARGRALNELLQVALLSGRVVPRQMRRRMFSRLEVAGAPIDPGALDPVTQHFAPALKNLIKRHPALDAVLSAPQPAVRWSEPPFTLGFRASQYIAAFLPDIDRATAEAPPEKRPVLETTRTPQAASRPAREQPAPRGPSPTARALMPPAALENYQSLQGGRFAPHNKMGSVNEEELAAPYQEGTARELPKGSTGNVIVGCMKNEAPYILEWVAYHRAIGVDNFLIYTNDCTDGTDEILGRLQQMGLLQHRNNDKWRGNSPQQFALNQSLKEPMIKKADWIIHIDVDEFINVRTGNGTLPELLALVPDATNVAMTWRLFGNNGVVDFEDRPVIEQFEACAPKYCPKPHTVWGFKTMTKNIGAYEKISCHRPNKLRNGKSDEVQWVNGSGQVMRPEIKEKGWRSELRTIGYDLIQLNHYALRSADSYLIKRQRGRALHVDRSIGINYWIRMDWSDHRDVTIQRNLPRLKAEMTRLLQDKKLAKLHREGIAWHQAKAAELHANPEFRELFDQAQEIKLTPLERVAYALALDMES